ncbi:uncharacterized protein AB675_5247 [Cyphellophora attinorum]|uniref:Uncharacterized protein n=1 Tax=Cyphellophora attinorum TaxID=1664694 RepID=A0A0N0NLL2_9EURO|nr:uncharacterized protein AB675_5247 [Phialophora attinorum]KPI39308.1 hypothetical protein AB675_5247 [Phialophora attinorum]
MARLQALMLALPILLLFVLSSHAQKEGSCFGGPIFNSASSNSGATGLPTTQDIPTHVLIDEVAGRIGVEYTNPGGAVAIYKGFHIEGSHFSLTHCACTMCPVALIDRDVHTTKIKIMTETEVRLEFAELLKAYASAATLSNPDLAEELERRWKLDAGAILTILNFGSNSKVTLAELHEQLPFDIDSASKAQWQGCLLSAQGNGLEERILRNADILGKFEGYKDSVLT